MKLLSWKKIVVGGGILILVIVGGAWVYWWSLSPDDLLGNGMGAAWKGDYDLAIRELTLDIYRDPHPEYAYFNRAYAYLEKGDLAKSNADLDYLIKLHPDFGAAYLNRGENYRTMRDFPRAIADQTKAIEFGTPNAYSYRGLVYFDQGDYDKAIADFSEQIEPSGEVRRTGYLSNSSATITKNPIEPFGYRGTAYYRKGDYEHALPDLKKAIEVDSQNLNAYELLGSILSTRETMIRPWLPLTGPFHWDRRMRTSSMTLVARTSLSERLMLPWRVSRRLSRWIRASRCLTSTGPRFITIEASSTRRSTIAMKRFV
jgi:tetratricopeptide (TPR) repeat protein